MECQSLFSKIKIFKTFFPGNIKKNISKWLLKNLPSILSVEVYHFKKSLPTENGSSGLYEQWRSRSVSYAKQSDEGLSYFPIYSTVSNNSVSGRPDQTAWMRSLIRPALSTYVLKTPFPRRSSISKKKLYLITSTQRLLCWTVFLTERIPHAGVINSTEFFTFGQRWRIRFADLEFLTQTSLSHIRISIACTPVNKFIMNGNIFCEI